eukprot:TRINITY_DN5168_c0_g1_i1.p1 TRINITY_DN5168_c0_g1~~TRINITY_DN5168_c0_g1_i1.p1  ORF type:complete len:278 (-),score=52.96 TRINITY_DN5168_c0_g1_i1:173-1006(-)
MAEQKNNRCENLVVVVTGASKGIGASLSRELVKRGSKVVLAARSAEALNTLQSELGAEHTFAVVADVTKRADHESLLAAAIEHFGKVDVWVNNAGQGITRSVEELTDDDFDQMMLVNTKSALYGMQTVVPYFKQQGKGQVINVSSMLGRIASAPLRSAYCAAKHALNSLTCSYRLEMKKQGYNDIHICLFSPGPVATDFGLNALHGGPDNRNIPGSQNVDEVGVVMADQIEHLRVDVYSRPIYHQFISDYYSAEDKSLAESRPPFVFPAPAPAPSSN